MAKYSKFRVKKFWISVVVILCLIAATVSLEGVLLANYFQIEKHAFLVPEVGLDGSATSLSVMVYEPKNGHGTSSSLILLIHGFASSSKMMESMALQMVQEGLIVVSYDLLGHGHSESSFAVVDWPELLDFLVQQAKNVLDFIMNEYLRDHFIEKIAIIGHSLGANVALGLGLLEPDLVDAVVLLGALTMSPYHPRQEHSMNETVPRNVLIISGYFDQLVDVESAKTFFRPLFPETLQNLDSETEIGDVKKGSGRKFIMVDSDHVLLPLHPRVQEVTLEWLWKSSFLSVFDSSRVLVGSFLIGVHVSIVFLRSILFLLILLILSLVMSVLIFKKKHDDGSSVKNSSGKKLNYRPFLGKNRYLVAVYLFLTELIAFIFGLFLGYVFMMLLLQVRIKIILLIFIIVFWTLFLVFFMFLRLFLHSFDKLGEKCEKNSFLWIRSHDCYKDMLFYGGSSLIVVFFLIVGLEMMPSFLESTFLVVSLRVFPLERLLSMLLSFIMIIIHYHALFLFFEHVSIEKRSVVRRVVVIVLLLSTVLSSVALLVTLIPSFVIPSMYKSGVLFVVATTIFSMILGLIVLISFLMVTYWIFPSFKQVFHDHLILSVMILSLLQSVVMVSMYPVIG